MRCEQVERVLSSSMDDPLSPPLPDAVRAHAEACPRCRAFDRASWTIRKAARLEVAPPVPDLAPAIMERIAAEGARSPMHGPLRPRRRRIPGALGLTGAHPLRRVIALGLAAGVVAGFVLTGGLLPNSSPGTAALASEIPQRLVAAAEGLRGYRATFDVVERDWAHAV